MARLGCFRGRAHYGILAALLGAGCNSLDPPVEERARLVIPTDTRPAESAAEPPPPVSGGTLLVTQSGTMAVAAVPELHAVMGVSLSDSRVLWSLPLERSDGPGRLVEDETGVIHVVLRRGGAVASIDPSEGKLIRRRDVCAAPRGIAVTAPGELTVACATGELVTLPTGDGEPTRVLTLPLDLRDVVVRGDELIVSRFKSVELVHLNREGAVTGTTRARSVLGRRVLPDGDGTGDVQVREPFAPRIAWRTLVATDGSIVTVHQRALESEVVLSEPSPDGNAYGGTSLTPCNSIVQNAVTVVHPDGTMTDVTFSGAPLPVDAALLPDGYLVVAHAGPSDPGAPRPFVVTETASGSSAGGVAAPAFSQTLSVLQLTAASSPSVNVDGEGMTDPGCMVGSTFLPTLQPAVAIASNPKSPKQVVVQLRDPATLLVLDDVAGPLTRTTRTIPLDAFGSSDTGFDLFHRDSGAGIACASCHPEGGEDGHVWQFSQIGPRRTQALNAAIEHTAPYHWDGDLPGLSDIMSAVFVGRMGGVHQSPERLASLESWLFSIPTPAPLRRADDAAVQRGRALFESTETGCATCHSGKWLTNNQSVAVGTGKALQVPSLVGIAHRAPFLHDGCAKTLRDRFDPACGGGEAHGTVASLSPAELDDLVAYLESL